MKKQPKAVYIIENGGYTELTYEEFCRREQICPLYADKLFCYQAYYPKRITQDKARQKYWTNALTSPIC